MTFVQMFTQITEPEISQLESRLGMRIPLTYRLFLLEHNGGIPTNCKIISRLASASFVVGRFLPIASKKDVGFANLESIVSAYKIKDDRLPPNLFPFATDPFGNLFCISMLSGEIFFWDHESESLDDEEEDSSRPAARKIADDWKHFCDSLETL